MIPRRFSAISSRFLAAMCPVQLRKHSWKRERPSIETVTSVLPCKGKVCSFRLLLGSSALQTSASEMCCDLSLAAQADTQQGRTYGVPAGYPCSSWCPTWTAVPHFEIPSVWKTLVIAIGISRFVCAAGLSEPKGAGDQLGNCLWKSSLDRNPRGEKAAMTWTG